MAVGGITLSHLLFSALHFIQFALAITVCALYGIELDRTRKAGAHADGRWVCTAPTLPAKLSMTPRLVTNLVKLRVES